MQPQFIYFDLDDTLLDHRQAEKQGLHDVYQHFDLFDKTTFENFDAIYHEVNKEQWDLYARNEIDRDELQRNRFEQTLQKLGLDGAMHDQVGSYYMEAYSNHWQWMEGAREAYETIRERYPVGILTNGFSETQKRKFERFNLYESARHLVISEEVGYLKPHPAIFEHATRLAGEKPEHILYAGDSLSSDVEGGSNYGWKVAWYRSNGQDADPDKAVLAFDDFKDLCRFLEIGP